VLPRKIYKGACAYHNELEHFHCSEDCLCRHIPDKIAVFLRSQLRLSLEDLWGKKYSLFLVFDVEELDAYKLEGDLITLKMEEATGESIKIVMTWREQDAWGVA